MPPLLPPCPHTQVAALTNGSVEKVARPVLEGGGAAGLVGEGALLDINMAQVNGACGKGAWSRSWKGGLAGVCCIAHLQRC